ncbi:Kelch 1 and BACK and BTB domain containing protei n [Trichuris trichiura]|uniref:Kelch 1 and BACK and BTB domain containing protei n n=1 Tax=Trichuris trichiura TaxID=36087 RepID=A0A077YX06_TRITR|nr:Kelch 1 and BACK and BTB domain containing protei n [Trichuris trichiura]
MANHHCRIAPVDYEWEYVANGHRQGAFVAFQELRRDGLLCDVTLLAEGKRLSAHRVVLAATIPYFRAMFTIDMMEKSAQEINIQDIGFDALQDIINFVYTGKILLTLQSAPTVLMASAYLQIDSLVDACNGFLINKISRYNIEDLIFLGKYSNCAQLVNLACNFMLKYFLQYSTQERFLQTSYESLVDLLKDDKLVVCTELDVFRAIKRWVKADLTNRAKFVRSLLTCVRLHLLPKQCLANVILSDDLVQNFAKDVRLMEDDGSSEDELEMPNLRCRITGINVGEIEANPRNWNLVAKHIYLSGNSVSQKSICLQRCVVGGNNHAGPLCSVECYDVRQDAWTSLASMNVRRSMTAVVEYDGCLFSFGGFDAHDPLCTSEVYNPKENEWQFLNASNGIQGGCTAATVPIVHTLE